MIVPRTRVKGARWCRRTGLVTALAGALILLCGESASAHDLSPRRLLEVADLSGPVISPDGRQVAVRLEQPSVERNIHDMAWYVIDLDGSSPPRRVADAGAPIMESWGLVQPPQVQWSPDGLWIYYRAAFEGEIAVWRAAADGSISEPVTHDAANVRTFHLGADGVTLTYSTGATRDAVADAEKSEYDHGIQINALTPVGQGSLFRSANLEGRWASPRFDSAEGWLRQPLLASTPHRWRSLNLISREVREVPPSHPTGQKTASLPDAWITASEPDGVRAAVLTRVGDDSGLYEKPDVELSMRSGPDGREHLVCRAELCINRTITGVQWRPETDEVLFTTTDRNAGQAQTIFRWNVATGAVETLIRGEGLINGGRDRYSHCGISAMVLACVAAEADGPPRLERIDLDTGKRTVLFEPNAALAQDLAARPRVRLLRWTDENGHVYTGQYFPAGPTDGRPSPLFVSYYNCDGFLRGGLGDEWPLASLAEAGVAALCINAAPYLLDAVARYDRGISGTASAIRLLADQGEIDPAKVGMGGLSMGAEVTMWTTMRSSLLAAASVSSPFAPPSYHLFGSLRNDAFLAQLSRYWQLGSPEETPKRWRTLSPVFNLNRIRTPVLMQLPEQEYVMSLDYAVPMIRRSQADLYVFPDEAHQKFQPRHKLAVYQRNLDWFRFWLQDFEDLDPAKAVQYRRWREIRNARNAGCWQVDCRRSAAASAPPTQSITEPRAGRHRSHHRLHAASRRRE